MTAREAAQRIVENLNDRSGVDLDYDDDIMEDIYTEIENVIIDYAIARNK